MAFATYDYKHGPLVVLILIFISSSTCKFGRAYDYPQLGAAGVVANEYLPEAENGESSGYLPQGGGVGTSSDLILEKALHCFDDKYIYSSCGEAYRLNQGGELAVPPDYTDHYCNGPCITETQHVLACIHGIFGQFLFYNKATLSDIADTIESGCGYGPQRGNFDVAEHIQANGAPANKLLNPAVYASLLLISMIYNVLF